MSGNLKYKKDNKWHEFFKINKTETNKYHIKLPGGWLVNFGRVFVPPSSWEKTWRDSYYSNYKTDISLDEYIETPYVFANIEFQGISNDEASLAMVRYVIDSEPHFFHVCLLSTRGKPETTINVAFFMIGKYK